MEVKGVITLGFSLLIFHSSDPSEEQALISESNLFSDCCKRELKSILCQFSQFSKVNGRIKTCAVL